MIEAVNKAKTGSKIRVNLLKTTKIPANVFESIKGKDMNVTFKVSDQASWIINGKDITECDSADRSWSGCGNK